MDGANRPKDAAATNPAEAKPEVAAGAPAPITRTAPAVVDDRRAAMDHPMLAYGLERLVFFSDAVFAIAITLLAITLRVPDLPPGQTDASFLRALGELGSEFFAFVVSFFVIAAFWVGHYRTFRYVVAADGRLVILNFLFLFCIASLPFPTSMIATAGDVRSAVIAYAAWVTVTGLLSTALWVYPAQVAHLTAPVVTPRIARSVTYGAAIIPIAFGLSILVAAVAPSLAWVFWLLAVPIQVVVARRLLRDALPR